MYNGLGAHSLKAKLRLLGQKIRIFNNDCRHICIMPKNFLYFDLIINRYLLLDNLPCVNQTSGNASWVGLYSGTDVCTANKPSCWDQGAWFHQIHRQSRHLPRHQSHRHTRLQVPDGPSLCWECFLHSVRSKILFSFRISVNLFYFRQFRKWQYLWKIQLFEKP